MGLQCVLCTAPDVVVMKMHDRVIGSRTGLRMMMFGAGVLAMLVLACMGAAAGAGAEWDVYPGEGTPIQDAIDGAGAGDMIYAHAGT